MRSEAPPSKSGQVLRVQAGVRMPLRRTNLFARESLISKGVTVMLRRDASHDSWQLLNTHSRSPRGNVVKLHEVLVYLHQQKHDVILATQG